MRGKTTPERKTAAVRAALSHGVRCRARGRRRRTALRMKIRAGSRLSVSSTRHDFGRGDMNSFFFFLFFFSLTPLPGITDGHEFLGIPMHTD